MSSYKGHCHCGNTEWEAKLESDQQGHILCHCDTCKSLSGSTFTLNQIIPKAALSITKGEADLGKVMGPDKIVLRTGLLTEGIKNFKPAAEIFGKAKLPWEKEVAQTFETLPPS
ncbi:hypothetical protein SLS60_009075 [Paraconiothyrium brasiliense]|uniref:CENP-V/GFA domain-containing protein n=1 Tax=Paraconiothyrium brasiliense TaxID=300254 RepID=A0ABR3QX06_9PLEO